MNRPNIRKQGAYYIFRPTESAAKLKSQPRQRKKAIPQEDVHAIALNRAREAGIRNPDANTVRGFYEMQIGEYQGQTFRWLLENDLGYVTYLLTQIEREGGNTGQNNMNDNKRQLKWYVESFPDGRAALAQRRKENETKETTRKQKSSLVTSKLPPSEVARRLQKGPQAGRMTPNIPSPIKNLKPNIPAATVSAELDDNTLLSEVEALESSQSMLPAETAQFTESCTTKTQSSPPQLEAILETQPANPKCVTSVESPCSKTLSSAGADSPCTEEPNNAEANSPCSKKPKIGEPESSHPKTLSQLRAKVSLTGQLSQPG